MAIQLVDLVKTFGDVVACDQLSLEVREGELVTLLGPSGCGKTTALRCVTGSLRPDAGCILINGRDVTNVPTHKRNIGLVFQNFALFPHLTVLANVEYPLRVRGMRGAARRARALEALRLVHLEGLERRFPRELSGGQQQRVGLARALVYEPTVILFDEPLSNLDAKLRLEMREEIAALRERIGFTSIYVTHDQEEAFSLSDRVAVMEHGVIHQVGTPSELYTAPQTPFVAEFLGHPNRLGGRCVERGDDWALIQGAGQRLFAVTGSGGPAVGEQATVYVRPEAIRVGGAASEAEALVEATVSRSAFLGGSVEYSVQLDATATWHLRLDNDARLAVGERVRLVVPRSACRAFAAEAETVASDGGPAT